MNASWPHTLMLMNRTSGWRKHDCEPVAKSVRRVPTQITRSAAAMIAAAVPVPSRPMAAQRHRRAFLHRPLAGEGLADGDAQRLGEVLQLAPRLGVMHAAAGDDHRPLGLREQRDRLADPLGIGRPALDPPAALAEEVRGIIVGMCLDVLRQRDRDGARLGRVGQHAHRLRQGGQDLLGAGDPVEEPADRPEAVVDAHVGRDRVLELLEHRPLMPGRVVIGGEQAAPAGG